MRMLFLTIFIINAAASSLRAGEIPVVYIKSQEAVSFPTSQRYKNVEHFQEAVVLNGKLLPIFNSYVRYFPKPEADSDIKVKRQALFNPAQEELKAISGEMPDDLCERARKALKAEVDGSEFEDCIVGLYNKNLHITLHHPAYNEDNRKLIIAARFSKPVGHHAPIHFWLTHEDGETKFLAIH